ncbi:MAG: DUF370 domain-containing protein [Clostridia bacterium]|nr:DUF370 domain-containing protein [Clostridia bacterium]
MYLHLGQEIVVNQNDIVAIFDMDTATISKHTRDFLKKAEEKKIVFNISDNIPNSVVVCTIMGSEVVYISQISSQTLYKRMNFLDIYSQDKSHKEAK